MKRGGGEGKPRPGGGDGDDDDDGLSRKAMVAVAVLLVVCALVFFALGRDWGAKADFQIVAKEFRQPTRREAGAEGAEGAA